jgi:hypothetical protein
MKRLLASSLLGMCWLAGSIAAVYGAVGCSLNDPDRDIRRIFPEATGYKTAYITIRERGGDSLATEIETRLGDKLDEVYETTDVPYAYYAVLKGEEMIGRVHGVNQKGKYGGMQLILATDTEGTVVDFYYQKLSSPEAKRFRNPDFTDQFKGLSPADAYRYRYMPDAERAESRIGRIADPSEKSPEDFAATLRGVMKNLILLDEFQFHNRFYNGFRKEKAGRTDNVEGTMGAGESGGRGHVQPGKDASEEQTDEKHND